MHRIARLTALAIAAFAAFATSAAQGATLNIKQACAISRNGNGVGVGISGAGWSSPPGLASVRVTEFVGSQALNGANYAAPGGNLGPTTFGLLGLSKGEITYRLVAGDNDNNTASAQAQESAFNAVITPKSKHSAPKPRRAATISLEGWLGKVVYAHFIPPFPATKSKTTMTLGKSKGACGHLTKHVAHVFPFSPKPGGSWQIVFDTIKGNINFNSAYRARGYYLPNGRINPDYPKYVDIYESVPFS
jgi:hypothetical protein